MTKEELIAFEKGIADQFKAIQIKCPIHLSGGNEEQLIEVFGYIKSYDYVFSTHRNHYHYLLHTGDEEGLFNQILYENDSMHTCDPKRNFYSSSIVAGCVAIACGVALALKMKGSKQKVWCFIGDGACDEGWTQEAMKFATMQDLPITYIVEDNNRSVCSNIEQRWGTEAVLNFPTNRKVSYYSYECTYPHAGCGEWVTF